MIIDAHAHLCRKPDFRELERFIASGLIDRVWLMDLSGAKIEYYHLAEEAEVLEACRLFPDFFVPFGYLDLGEGPQAVDRQREKGFVGLKPYKPRLDYNHPDYFPVYRRAEELGMPILFHVGIVGNGDPSRQSPGLSNGPCNMRPSMLASIAEAFPSLTIIGGHLGFPWLNETELNLYYYPNICHDLSGYRQDIEWLIRVLDRKCNDGTRRYFNDKIFFATDGSYGKSEGHEEIKKLTAFWQLFMEMVGGNYYRWGEREEREKIMYGNADSIIGLR